MSKKIIILFLISTLLLVFNLLLLNSRKSLALAGKDDVEQMSRLTKSLNLINGLYLTEDQMKKLIPLQKKSGELEEKFLSGREELNSLISEILPAVNRELSSNVDLKENTKKTLHERTEKLREREDKYKEDMMVLVNQAKKILNENQLVIAGRYRPCLVPQISKEGFIGQAGDSNGLSQKLDKIRSASDEIYEKRKDRLLDKIEEKLKREFSSEETAKKLKEIENIIEQARAMNDKDYEIKRDTIVEKLQNIGTKKIEETTDRQSVLIGRFLLNPALCKVFEEKLI
ncbi:MAG: hypothetical protein ABRQ38_02995 [Candidatus Eremiobacterota bacterium]